nr:MULTISPECIES: YdcF family protein [unclassified Thioalkalivibrio]
MDPIPLRLLANWLLLPPSGPLILAIIGWAIYRTNVGKVLLVIGLLLSYSLSTPVFSYALIKPLQEGFAPPDDNQLADVQAIVVLGAGYRSGAEEFSGETVHDLALVRLRYAAYLHHRTGLPVMVSGGGPEGRVPEADYMAEVLKEYGVHPILREPNARDTWGNARHSAEQLHAEGIERVALVSHTHHMPRATWSFERAGLEVIPAPTGAYVPRDNGWSLEGFRPQASALWASWLALHEYWGMTWYRWQYGPE